MTYLESLTPEARDQCERFLAILEMHRPALEQIWLLPRLENMVVNGNDPREPDYYEDRLPGF